MSITRLDGAIPLGINHHMERLAGHLYLFGPCVCITASESQRTNTRDRLDKLRLPQGPTVSRDTRLGQTRWPVTRRVARSPSQRKGGKVVLGIIQLSFLSIGTRVDTVELPERHK